MIDINLIRDLKTQEIVIKSEKKRFRSEDKIKKIYELDKKIIKLKYEFEQNNKFINAKQKMISKSFKENFNIEIDSLKKEIEQKKNLNNELNIKIKEINMEIKTLLKSVGNVLHSDVIFSKNEDENLLIRKFDSERKVLGEKGFAELMKSFVGGDRGPKISGHRGYFLLGDLAMLSNALIRYSIDFLVERGYTLIQTPFLMNRDVMEKTVQLSDFDEQLYKVGDSQYLIATSEQPISSMYMNERFDPSELPIRFCGQSTCFRKEAGAHGKDSQGIFRVHQFEKIEQFVICAPSKSMDFFKQMVEISEEFLKSLDISFRTVSIVSGEMNDAASIKYDIEAYFPYHKKYRELVSVSNCTDYQSRELEIRYGAVKDKNEKLYVHMLNGTLCAIQRTLCCIVENYQTPYGIMVPDVLKKYFGKGFIPFK